MTETRPTNFAASPGSEGPAAAAGIGAAEAGLALERVLASEQFRTAPQLSAFLAFVVNRTREGRSAEIKGYTIATEALGRPASFDPQTDPIVRVEAMRLRRALDAYYGGQGAADPVRIVLPRGGYVPAFVAADAVRAAPEPAARRRFGGMAAAALALAAAVLVAALIVLPLRPTRTPDFAVIPVPGLALIEVVASDGESPAHRFAGRVAEFLARFEEIEVVDLTHRPAPARRAVEAPSLRYVLSVTGFSGGDEDRIAARLTYGPTGQMVWSADLPASVEADMTAISTIAAQIGQPYGIIFADLRGREGIHRTARCLIDAYDHRTAPSAAGHAAARDCLESIDASGNALAAIRFHLTRLYIEEERRGFNRRPDPLGRALAAAESAVRASPASARARHALMTALFARRDFDRAIAAGFEAHRLNPSDTVTMGDLGIALIATTRYREGLDLVERALDLNPARPAGADFHIFLAAHMLGEREKAQAAVARLARRDTVLSVLAQIAVADETDDEIEALVQRLTQLDPEIARKPAKALERLNIAPEIAARLAADLRRVGLVTAATSTTGKPQTVPQ